MGSLDNAAPRIFHPGMSDLSGDGSGIDRLMTRHAFLWDGGDGRAATIVRRDTEGREAVHAADFLSRPSHRHPAIAPNSAGP